MTPLDTVLISDGKPGHYHLAEGVLAAIARKRPLRVHRLEVRRPRWLPARALSALTNAGLAPDRILKLVYGVDRADLPGAGLIVSAGGDTLAANIAVARLLQAPNIFYGSLRRFRPEDFSLVLTSYPRNQDQPYHLMTLKPSAVDPTRDPPLPIPAAGQAPVMAGLLIGGNAGTFQFARSDWQRLIGFLAAQHARYGTAWIVSNSRRTPDWVGNELARMAADPKGAIDTFIDVRSAGSGTLRPLFARSQAILCTADSSSMLSESIWMRRPVIAVFPARSSLPADEAQYRQFLRDKGWTRSLTIDDLDPDLFAAELGKVRPLDANPLDLLAGELSQRLPAVFDAGQPA